MHRLFFGFLLLCLSQNAMAQQHSMALGIYSGMTVPYTFDEGIAEDPRYQERFTGKFAPVGISFSLDYKGFGLIASPGLITLGQNFSITNIYGGHDGRRIINLNYLNVPVGIKIHIIDLSFFRVSGIASISTAYLLNASDKISHAETKLTFPAETVLPDNYTLEYDGVLVPRLKNETVIPKEGYNSLQFFAAAGIRSDWDLSNTIRVSFDFRVNYGLTDPRSDDYMKLVDNYQALYDTPGRRNEMFVQLSLGIARYIDWDKNDKARQKGLKGGSGKIFPGKKSTPKRRRPRG